MGKNSKERQRQCEADLQEKPLVVAIPPEAKFYCNVHRVFFRSKAAAGGDMDMITGHGGPRQCGRCLQRFASKAELQRHRNMLVRDHSFPCPIATVSWKAAWIEAWRNQGVADDVLAPFEQHYYNAADGEHQAAAGNDHDETVRLLLLRLPPGQELSAIIPEPGRFNTT